MSTYDAAQRQQIRQALKDYMQVQGIGAPTLARRIQNSAAGESRRVQLSTLQRFLRDTAEPKDSFVSVCEMFVRTHKL